MTAYQTDGIADSDRHSRVPQLAAIRGKPSVIIMSVRDYIIMSVRDYVRNVAPTPAAYRSIREEAKQNGTNSLSMREVEREIAAYRRQSKKNRNHPGA